ncbi:MAG TPA: tRNA (adenosine(37)-N6)-dimethylallyltransferase MiaA [Flavobacteriales bacterium]|jgi:tRNA dimethylallyltransferase|nr:tRNA (adenosine(37)-N6)-dimethylallyltransferase MiaA [Flavobacteriales bacterium]HJN63482.1 tRNA (adenosine(37)-N6)-dimethylallyltransferase MiaA [Flavobacteriales bacterium]|tara:strand:- start:2434 stop:3342 length:909 start_codon:yes stop_codon:yes gene_type:complete
MSVANKNKRLIVISGATAIGKTALSIQLALHFNSEIISADSRQFYKELKIGAAPPSEEELAKVKHHFIQHLSVKDDYNVGLFEKDAIAVLYTLFKKTDTLIMAGGSGLYIDAVCNGLDTFPKVNEKIKKELIAEYKNKGITFLQDELKQRDPVYFDIVDINNPQRLIRALVVIRESRKPFSSFRNKTSAKRDFKISHFSLEMEREKLYERINRRVDLMMEEGLVNEVENLITYRNKNALQTVGYKELFAFFDGEMNLEEAIEKIKQNTRRFAKRQISWFKRDESIQHLKMENAFQKIIGSLT